MSGSYTFSPQSFASTSSNATDTDSSPYRSPFMTSSVIACASRCFCCSDLPGHSFTITCGMALPSSVLLVGDVFEPIDGLAIEVLLHGDVRHRRCWRRAMPVLFARRKPHDVARANLFNGSAPPPARIVQEEARERLTPLLKDANERAGIEMRRGAILSEVRQADAIERRPNYQFQIVHDQWPIDRDRQRALALVELPAIDLVTVVSEVDAAVLQQIARRLGAGMRMEVRR